MLKSFPYRSVALTSAVLGLDGLAASYDIDSYAKKQAAATPPVLVPHGTPPPILQSKAFLVQAGAAALGVVGEFLGWPLDVTESLMGAGIGAMAREGAFRVAQGQQANPTQAQGFVGRVAAPAGWPAAAMNGGSTAQPALAFPNVVNISGQRLPQIQPIAG